MPTTRPSCTQTYPESGALVSSAEIAVHRNADYLRRWFFQQPFLPYAPIRWQLKTLLREVNKLRRHAFGEISGSKPGLESLATPL